MTGFSRNPSAIRADSASPRCPSCGRPLAVRLGRCPYCAEAIPGAVRHRAVFAIATALAFSMIAFAALSLPPSLPDALSALFRSPPAAAALSLAAIAIFATFPQHRPGVASLSMPSILADLAIRLLAFAAIVLAAALAYSI